MLHSLTSARTRRSNKVAVAQKLVRLHGMQSRLQSQSQASTPLDPIRVVCISDTHNTRPILPPGDVLIHAGDLTENGSFDEVQAELIWLSTQPHRYKILIAGNHDVLLDDDFLQKYPERRYGQLKTLHDLDWGDVIYLKDSCTTLTFPSSPGSTNDSPSELTIFGSPWTPRYGVSAFQYHPNDEDHWRSRLSSLDPKPDIVVTHGPPKHHLDKRDFHRAGCPHLAEQIAEIRPKLAVFGHIHVGYGREDVVLDRVQRIYEEALTGWASWGDVFEMVALVIWAKLMRLLPRAGSASKQPTVCVNASMMGGSKNALANTPIVVEL